MKTFLEVVNTSFPRRKIVSFVFLIAALLVAFTVGGYIVRDDFTSLAFTALVLAGCAIVVVVIDRWQKGLYLFLAWLLFEDLARKFLGNNMAIYFAKDALLLIVYLSFFAAYRRKEKERDPFRPPFLMILLIFVWFGAAQVFNPASTSLVYGLLGMKLYFAYGPLLFVGYGLIACEADLRRFFRINLGLMFVIISMGTVQAIMGHTFLNPEVLGEDIRRLSESYREAPISGVVSMGRCNTRSKPTQGF